MGDHARNVARFVLRLNGPAGGAGDPVLSLPAEVLAMAELDRTRLRESLAALRARDERAAREIALRDAETDACRTRPTAPCWGRCRPEPELVPQATLLLRAAYAFERIGDRVTNVCERVIYAVTGQLEELNVFPGDRL